MFDRCETEAQKSRRMQPVVAPWLSELCTRTQEVCDRAFILGFLNLQLSSWPPSCLFPLIGNITSVIITKHQTRIWRRSGR